MSDPFERLRESTFDASPDVDAIKLRAHRIKRRRQTGVASAGVAALAVIAVVGVLLTSGSDGKPKSLAEASRTTAPQAAAARQAPAADLSVGQSKVEPGSSPSKSVGGGAATTGTTSAEGRASSDMAAAAPARAGNVEELQATLDVENRTIGRGKAFTLKVCNVTSGEVKRSFGSSQRYDFEVSENGNLVWRWSDGQFFTQVIGEETWKAKECKTWTQEWDATNSSGAPVSPGDYKAVGVLKSSPELRTPPKTFSLSAL